MKEKEFVEKLDRKKTTELGKLEASILKGFDLFTAAHPIQFKRLI